MHQAPHGCVQDKTVLLSKEAERLKSERGSAKDQVSQLKDVLEQVNQAQQGASRLSLQQLHQIYSDLKERFPAEYVMYRLPDIALTQVRCHDALNPPPQSY